MELHAAPSRLEICREAQVKLGKHPQQCPTGAWNHGKQEKRQVGDRTSVVVSVAASVKETAAAPTHTQSASPSEAARKAAFTTVRPPQQAEAFELKVEGQTPSWLNGSLVRNGPGFFAPEMLHLFDGYGMLVKFTFENGRVFTMQRFVESVAYKQWERTGRMQFAEFGTQVSLAKSLWNTAMGMTGLGQGFTDNAGVNTLPLPDGKSMIAMTEAAPGFFKVDLDSLATLHRVEYKDGFKGALTSVHPVVYPDGTVYNLVLDLGKSRSLVKIDSATQERTFVADVPMDNPTAPCWIHDLPATENYIIVPDTPTVYDLKGLVVGGSDYVVFNWSPETQPTKFHVIDKRSGALTTHTAPFDYMAFHFANAWESADGSQIVMDVPTFKDPEMVNSLKLDNMRSLSRPVPEGVFSRITITLDGSSPPSIRPAVPVEDCMFAELPRINPDYKPLKGHPQVVCSNLQFRESQFTYAVSAKLPTSYGNALSKLDAKNGSSKQWHEPGCIPTEPLMIPRPGARAEDEGVVTSSVTGADGSSFLVVLDAASFEEIARVTLPYTVAYGFHNQFFPA